MKKQHNMLMISNIMLIIAAMIWGANYIFQKIVANMIGPFTFMSARTALGTIFIFCVIMILRARSKVSGNFSNDAASDDFKISGRFLLIACGCGIVNVTGSALVQLGLIYTTASKASFLSALYIVLVPVLGLLIFHKKTSALIWVGIMLAVAGLYELCAKGSMLLSFGDGMILLSAFFSALHIQLVSKFVNIYRGIYLACAEFFFGSIYCGILALIIEHPSISQLVACSGSILFAGVLGIGVCYVLQYTAQEHTDPTIAALLMSLESVFGALGGVLILGETLTHKEIIGILLIICSMIICQLPSDIFTFLSSKWRKKS